jgi:hypothetical protein
MAFKCTGALVALMFLEVTSSPAQTAPLPRTASLRGVVRGERSVVLPDADVFLNHDSLHARTDPNGRFRFSPLPEGSYWLFVRRIGYAPARRLVTLKAGDEVELTIRLSPFPVVLPDIEVQAETDKELRRLMARTRNAWGRSVTEAEILRNGSLGLSVIVKQELPQQAVSRWDIIRRSVRATSSMNRAGSGPAPARRRTGMPESPGGVQRASGPGEGCPPAVSVNGELPWSESLVDDIPPDAVASMEIYKPKARGGHVPTDFSFYPQAINCGLVVIWLR